jgi:hypothetical protein
VVGGRQLGLGDIGGQSLLGEGRSPTQTWAGRRVRGTGRGRHTDVPQRRRPTATHRLHQSSPRTRRQYPDLGSQQPSSRPGSGCDTCPGWFRRDADGAPITRSPRGAHEIPTKRAPRSRKRGQVTHSEQGKSWRRRAESNRRTGLCSYENVVRSRSAAFIGPGQSPCEFTAIRPDSWRMRHHSVIESVGFSGLMGTWLTRPDHARRENPIDKPHQPGVLGYLSLTGREYLRHGQQRDETTETSSETVARWSRCDQ